MDFVIVDSSFGNTSVYPANLKNAKKILDSHLDALNPEVLELIEKDKTVITTQSITTVVNNILKMSEGQAASKSITVTKEMKQEVVMYCFNNKVAIKNDSIEEFSFFKVFKLEDLSFFANNPKYPKDSIIVDKYIHEQARKYKVIKNDTWKDGAKEIAKVRYILDFAQELAHRDVKYEVVEMSEVS